MKRVLLRFGIILLLLCACSAGPEPETNGDALIKPAELTNYEKNLTDLIGAQSFVFDLELNNENVKEIHTTIDYYENGELISTLGELGSGLNKKDMEEPIRAVFLRSKVNKEEEKWISSIMTSNGQGIQNALYDISTREEMSSTASGGISMPTPLYIGEKKVIATIVHSNQNGVAIYNEISTEDDLRKATDYEQVYVITIELR